MALILWRTLSGQRIAILLLSLGLFGFAFLIPATFDAFGGEAGSIFESVPETLRTLLKAPAGLMSTPTGYLATGYRHPVFLVILVAFIIASSSGAMAREIERGTVFLLLARPISRYRMVLAKLGSMLTGVLLFLAMALLGSWAGALTYSLEGVDFASLLLVQLNALFLALAIGGYSFLISALASEGGRVITVAASVTVAFFFLDFLAGLWTAIDFLGPASLFHYYDPVSIVDAGSIPALHLGVLGAVAVATFAAALIAFQRRDIAG